MLNDVTKVFVKIQNAQTFEQRRSVNCIMMTRASVTAPTQAVFFRPIEDATIAYNHQPTMLCFISFIYNGLKRYSSHCISLCRDLIMFLRLSCRRHTLMRSHFGTSSSDPSTSSASQEHANDLEFAHHAMSQHIEMRLEEMGLAGSSSGGSDYHSYDMTIPRPLWPRLSQLLNRS